MKRAALLGSALVAVLAVASTASGSALLVDRNATLEIDPYSDAGLFNWTVDGIDAMVTEWYWVRIGDTGPEQPISDLVLSEMHLTETDLGDDPGEETLVLVYADQYDPAQGIEPNWSIRLRYMLTGGAIGSNTSAAAVQIHVRNYTGESLDFHLFEYNDIELAGTADNDTVEITGAPVYNVADQSDPDGVSLTTEAVAPRPTGYQAGLGSSLLDLLNDAGPTTLTNDAGPYTGDAVWAFQWDWNIEPHGSFILSKVKDVHVPEPASLLLIACGGMVALVRRRRRPTT
jgi:hypothetical protein